jgi:hypothetical protein
MNNEQNPNADNSPAAGVFTRFFRWLFCWRVASRGLFVLACLVTLIGLFYAVENWRGKSAWEKCRRELEAKGEVFDWNAYIPAPVPDDQNIFKAPKIAEWFVRGPHFFGSGPFVVVPPEDRALFTQRQGGDPAARDVLVAEVKVVTPTIARGAEHAGQVLRFEDPAAGDQAAKLLGAAIGPCLEGPSACVVMARHFDQIKPAHLVLEAEAAPSVGALKQFFTRSPASQASPGSLIGDSLQVAAAGSNLFRVRLYWRVYSAADYLAWTQPAVSDLNVLRKALERPYARMDGNYERPYERPIPNFVLMRAVVKMLAERAQCYLLLGQPEAAWHELAVVRDMCRMLEARPASDCPTLVEAMIDVAINGLYLSVVQDSLRLQAWGEPELAAMQKQLTDVRLLPLVRAAFVAQRAATCRTFEITPRAELVKLFASGGDDHSLWGRLKNPRFLLIRFAPRGWLYQNMCAGAIENRLIVSSLDISNDQVLPHVADATSNQAQTALSHFTPYTFIFKATLHDFLIATQTLAQKQTLANEAFIACGLERYRLAHGQYPETLEALVPQFAEKLPHDIIGGQPLKYRRTADSQFVLYSVGWNETDDGGVPGKTIPEGDWVWP